MERKVKYSYEFKLRCVNEVLYQHKSVNSVAKSNGVDHKSVDLWLSFYQKYGKLGLLPRKNKTYSVDFKLKVLKMIKAKNLYKSISNSEILKDINPDLSQLSEKNRKFYLELTQTELNI